MMLLYQFFLFDLTSDFITFCHHIADTDNQLDNINIGGGCPRTPLMLSFCLREQSDRIIGVLGQAVYKVLRISLFP